MTPLRLWLLSLIASHAPHHYRQEWNCALRFLSEQPEVGVCCCAEILRSGVSKFIRHQASAPFPEMPLEMTEAVAHFRTESPVIELFLRNAPI